MLINPSLRKFANKFLPVGIALVMTYLAHHNIDFDFRYDINELEDEKIEAYLENNRYDIRLSGSIVTHYKWMKWLTNTVRKYNKNSKIIRNSVAGSIPKLLKNSSADIAILGEGEIACLEVAYIIANNDFGTVLRV